MKIEYTPQFQNQYKQYISKDKNLRQDFKDALDLFKQGIDLYNSELRDHPLKNKLKGYRSFSINYSYRVVYRIRGGVVVLFRVGPHDEVYK